MNSNKWVRTIKNRKGHKGLQQGLGVFAAVLTFHPGFVNWKREKSLASLPSFPISLFCHKVWIRFLFSCACGCTNYLRNIQLRLSVLLLQGVGDQDESQVLFPDCQPLALTLFPALGVVQREAFTRCLTLGGTGEACRQITSWQTCVTVGTCRSEDISVGLVLSIFTRVWEIELRLPPPGENQGFITVQKHKF